MVIGGSWWFLVVLCISWWSGDLGIKGTGDQRIGGRFIWGFWDLEMGGWVDRGFGDLGISRLGDWGIVVLRIWGLGDGVVGDGGIGGSGDQGIGAYGGSWWFLVVLCGSCWFLVVLGGS